MKTEIKCPHCSQDISLDAIMQEQAKNIVTQEKQKLITDLKKEESRLSSEKEKLQKERETWTEQSAANLEKLKVDLTKKVHASVEATWAQKISFLENQLNSSESQLAESVKKEIEFRQKIKEVEKKERDLELTIESKLNDESLKIKNELTKTIAADYKQKDTEREMQMADLRNQIVEWKQKAEQGSQQLQGEVLELELETQLRSSFPTDVIEPVPKGVAGADLIQDVISRTGLRYGRIAWETKRTKNFSPSWITKLKTDRNDSKADLAVLVTQTMPEPNMLMTEIEGVWVIKQEVAIGVATLLRNALKENFKALAVAGSRSEKAEVIYNYLTSTNFRQRMETIVESFRSMRDDLEREKRVIQKSWKFRENQLENIFSASVGMYADIQSVLGASSFQIQLLEFNDSNGE